MQLCAEGGFGFRLLRRDAKAIKPKPPSFYIGLRPAGLLCFCYAAFALLLFYRHAKQGLRSKKQKQLA
jgi:hypothetical protein